MEKCSEKNTEKNTLTKEDGTNNIAKDEKSADGMSQEFGQIIDRCMDKLELDKCVLAKYHSSNAERMPLRIPNPSKLLGRVTLPAWVFSDASSVLAIPKAGLFNAYFKREKISS